MRHTIFLIIYSAQKLFKVENGGRLQSGIDETLRELCYVACRLRGRGYLKAAGLIERNARFIVTFAELALEGVRIPYTTNRIERLMSEVSKMCKKNWIHCSTSGLRNMLSTSQ